MMRDCLERGCPRLAVRGGYRCQPHEAIRQARRNADPKRQAYRDPLYLSQPMGGTCWMCGRDGADTRDHVLPIAVQMQRWNEVRDYRARPAHRACNSARGDREIIGIA